MATREMAILAAAHAEQGSFDEAIKWQKKALDLFRQANVNEVEANEKRLRQFEQG